MTDFQNTKLPSRVKDISGTRFGRLIVLKYVGVNKSRHANWECLCDCNNTTIVSSDHLKRKITQSCGCLLIEHLQRLNIDNTVHGRAKQTRDRNSFQTYQVWLNMKSRCNNANCDNYKYYGERGIKVCERWESFSNFLEDMGEKPDGLTLDRIDNSLGYFKENCRWATYTEQNRNKRGVKITMEIANKIRKDTRVHRIIADDYGISRENVGFIKSGIIWVDESHG